MHQIEFLTKLCLKNKYYNMSKLKDIRKQYNLYVQFIEYMFYDTKMSQRMKNIYSVNVKNECTVRKTNTGNYEKSVLGPNKK